MLASVNSLAIGKMYTYKGNVYMTKTNFSYDVGAVRLITKVFKNGQEIKSETYNNKLDLIESVFESVTSE